MDQSDTGPTRIAWWKLNGNGNESSGVSNAQLSLFAPETGVAPLAAGKSLPTRSSVGFDGSASYATTGHVDAFEVPTFGGMVLVQLDALPGAGKAMTIFSKDAIQQPNGFVVEIRRFAGESFARVRAYLRTDAGGIGTAQYFDSPSGTGVGTIEAGTAYYLAWSFDGTNGRLWINKTLVSTQPVAASGLVNNLGDIFIGSYDGDTDVGKLNGVLDQIQLWSGAITQTEVDAQPNATTISHSDSTRTFTLASAPNQQTRYKNLGNTKVQRFLDVGGDAVYDMRGTTFDNDVAIDKDSDTGITWPDNKSKRDIYSPSLNVRTSAAHNGGGLFGGTFVNGYGFFNATRWNPAASTPAVIGPVSQGGDTMARRYPSNHGGQLMLRDHNVSNFMIEGCRFHHCWDPIRFAKASSSIAISNVTVFRCWFSQVFDDCIENDNHQLFTAVECLMDGGFTWVSDRSDDNKPGPDHLIVVKDCLVWLEGRYIYKETGYPYKWKGNGNRVQSINCTYRIDKISVDHQDPGGTEPFFDINTRPGKVVNWKNNTILWTGAGNYPWPLPGDPNEWTIYTMSSTPNAVQRWNTLASAWKADNPHVPRIPGVDTA
jgi:hypothetical protein